MKALMVAGIALWGILPVWAAEQRAGTHAGGAPAAGHSRNSGEKGSGRPGAATRLGFYPSYWGYGDYAQEYPSAPSALTVTPPPPQPAPVEAPQPPPEPPRLVIREYKGAATGSDASAVFSIIAKDGSVRSAIAVWVLDGAVHYLDPDGVPAQVRLSSVDREATRRANAEKRLTLWLPAASEPTREP
jgi:hypothetical protein